MSHGVTVRFCTWCKEICVRGHKRPTDSVILYVYGEERKAFWNGAELIVADGICEQCRAEKFPETLKKGATNEPPSPL